MKFLKLRTWWKMIGLLMLIAMISVSLLVKYNLLPIPEVTIADIKGGYINGEFYEYIVPHEAVLKRDENGEEAMFITRKKDNYWLDGSYAVKILIDVLAVHDGQAAVSLLDHRRLTEQEKKVVMHPSNSFRAEQRVRIMD